MNPSTSRFRLGGLLLATVLAAACDKEPEGPADDDEDGFTVETDCDDTNPAVHPNAREICNGIDDNCDGEVDAADAEGATAWYLDTDGDGYGVSSDWIYACAASDRYVDNYADCDDEAAGVHPGADEVCDGVDQDCDGEVDDDPVDGDTWYPDADADAFGDQDSPVRACTRPPQHVADGTDCDDHDPKTNPNGVEVCDGFGGDQDCDGLVDDDDPTVTGTGTWYPDDDGDGYGEDGGAVHTCLRPGGFLPDAGDCDDGDSAVNPDATEVCGDGVDNDCDAFAMGCGPAGVGTDAHADQVWQGEYTKDYAATSLGWCGDLDGDGLVDLLIGSPGGDVRASDEGRVYFVGGTGASGTLSRASGEVAGWTDGGNLGDAIAGVGDIDGDGTNDFVAGAPGLGTVDLFLGPIAAFTSAKDADATWSVGDSGYGVGGVVSAAGAELLIGAPTWSDDTDEPGAAYIVTTAAAGDVDLADADVVLVGAVDGDRFGAAAIAVGDVLAFSAPRNDAGADAGGAVYLFAAGLSGEVDADSADFTLTGAEDDGAAGTALFASDVDDDGYDDLFVGAPGAGSDGEGAVYITLGPVTDDADVADADIHLEGSEADEHAGVAVTAGDLDDDGSLDVVVGAPGNDIVEANSGAAYVVYGPVSGVVSLADADAIIYGSKSISELGSTLVVPGDLDGDGYTDLAVGAPNYVSSSGGAFVFFGGPGF